MNRHLLPRVWRPITAATATAWVLVVLGGISGAAGVLAALVFASRGDFNEAGVNLFIGLLFGLLIGIGAWRYGLHPRLIAEPEGVRVCNPRGTVFIPWEEIRGAEPGYAGISIEMESGEVVTAWAVQKANWSRWQSRRTRADEVAEFLREHARAVD